MQEPVSTVLALAVALFFTASILAVHWFVGAFSDGDNSSKQDIPSQKEHLDETCLSQSEAQLFTSHSRRRSSRRSRFPRFASARINRSGPRCEVFKRRHRARPRQAPVFDAYRPSDDEEILDFTTETRNSGSSMVPITSAMSSSQAGFVAT